jgi:hypothetical protein
MYVIVSFCEAPLKDVVEAGLARLEGEADVGQMEGNTA